MGKTTIFAVLLGIAGGAGVGLGLAWDRPAPEVKTVAPNHQTAADTLATVAGKPITAADVDARIGSRLLRLRVEEHNLRRQALRGLIADALVQREATRRAVSVNELLQEEVEKKARPVADEEASAVYESAADRFRGVSQAEAVRTIRESMRRQRVSQRRDAFTRELAAGASVRLLLEAPRIAVDASDDPSLGPAGAPVTIVEFSDFQCPFCSQIAGSLREIESRYRGRVRLAFRDFPLPMHKDAARAAEAASCAADQGKYWEMHDRLFAGQKSLTRVDISRYALEAGLNGSRFEKCLDSGKYTTEWQADKAEGERYGVTGTPAVFVNGRPVFGAATLGDLVEMIEEELAQSKAATSR